MPLTILTSADNPALWTRCVRSFLDELDGATGPERFPAHLWLTQRAHRDGMLDAAAARGLPGWLDPPFSYMGEVPLRFGVKPATVGLLTRRRLVSRIAARHARRYGIGTAAADSGIVRGHMLDGLFGELLPEGVSPERLERALGELAGDEFSRDRNGWIVDTYRGYLEQLDFRGLYDFRSINAMLAERIEAGGLPDAIGGARRLYVYGLHSLRTRRRLLEALHRQDEVDVLLFAPAEEETGAWDVLGAPVQVVPGSPGERERVVQPAPNPRRELAWVATTIKRLLAEGGVEPRRVAVVARTGREDTRRAYEALRAAGVPATARIRTPLAEVPALRTLLELFRGAADGWSYRTLRHVLGSPYFDVRVDLRWVDFIASRRRPDTLAGWQEELERLIERRAALEQRDAGGDDAQRERRFGDAGAWHAERELRALGVWPDRMEKDRDRLERVRERLDPLAGPRPEKEWVELALRLVREGWFGLRHRVCDVPEDRYDVVRLDQRGLGTFESLLVEWSELEPEEDAPLSAADWYGLLRRLLQSHELALTTPQQRGVQVLEAHDAAATPFEHVFVIHANDGVFPRAPRVGGVLTEAERGVLRDRTGLHLSDFGSALREERSLWRAVTANPGVTISFRTTDPGGTPLLPSLMVERALPPSEWRDEVPRSFEPFGDPVNRAELQREAVRDLARAARAAAQDAAAAQDGPPPQPRPAPIVSVPDPHAVRHAVLNAWAEQARGARGWLFDDAVPGATPWSGQLEDPAVLEYLADRFGPDHVWSVSQLEKYAGCPFSFFLDNVLRLRAREEAEQETTPLTFGGLAHAILDAYYRPMVDAAHRPASFTESERRRLVDVAERVIREREAAGEWLGAPVLWSVKKRQLVSRLLGYLEWELEKGFEPGERPWECEWMLESPDAEPGAGEPIRLGGRDRAGAERVMRLTGRIDRVDVIEDDDGRRHRILDYKSNRTPEPREYDDGIAFQTALYMHALATADGLDVELGRYRSIREPKDTRSRTIRRDERFDFMLAVAFTVPERVRQGRFEAVTAYTRDWLPWDPPLALRRSTAQLADKGERWREPQP